MEDQGGFATAEAVIIVPIFMILIFLIVQIGIFAHAYEVIQASASDGLETASVPSASYPAVKTSVAEFIKNTSGGDVQLTRLNVQTGDYVTVTVTGRCLSILPFWSLTLSASASGDVQRFRASE